MREIFGPNDGDQLGYALGHAGDIDLDGFPDLLASAPGHDSITPLWTLYDRGMVYCYTVTGTELFWKLGGGGWYGNDVSGGLDLDLDGTPDFVVGSPQIVAGRVFAVSGAPGNPTLWDIPGAATGDEMGASVALIPDATGDGVPDVMVGAPGTDLGAFGNVGSASLLSGATGQVQYSTYGNQPGDRMGDAVGWGGYINPGRLRRPGRLRSQVEHHQHRRLGPDHARERGSAGGLLHRQGQLGGVHRRTSAPRECPPSRSTRRASPCTRPTCSRAKVGIMIWSRSAASTPFYGGTLCMSAPIKRTPIQTSTTQTQWPSLPCQGYYTFNFDEAYRSSKGIGAGDTVYLQYWSRDSGFAPPNSIGLTDALQVLVHP